MQQVIGFTTQDYMDGACGKYSIQHALLVLGIPVSQKEINKATRMHPLITRATGVGPGRIIHALEYFRCRAAERTADGAPAFREELDVMLAKGYPCIISVEGGSHWAVVAGRSHAGYYWIDSADEDVIGCWSWKKIVDWVDNDEYYLIGVMPRNARQLSHSLVPQFGRIAAMLEDKVLREHWGWYLEDLLECFDCPADGSDTVSANIFHKLYGKMLLNACRYYYIDADEEKMKWELTNYRTVAMAHQLTLRKSRIPEAIANLSGALTAIACTE